jgi:anthranilate synthase component II
MTQRILVIDNYDSFTFNLVQMFRQYDLEISIYRADKITVEEVKDRSPDYILISPGPKNPSCAGISKELIRRQYRETPILGVCLGMQCINEAFGGVTRRAPVPVHGKTSEVRHEGKGVFKGIPDPFRVARYHSLAVSDINNELDVTAHSSSDNVVMGLSHKEYPLHGVQFHPESFLTKNGYLIIENFLKTGPLRSTLS